MFRILILIYLSTMGSVETLRAQEDIERTQDLVEVRIVQNFQWKYNQQLELLRRVYPMALHAKKMITECNEDLGKITSKRKRKKYSRKANKLLKDEFNFSVKDLYQDEGRLFIRLIHRETNMTVSAIIKEYRGGFQNVFQSSLAKLGGHNLKDEYNPNGIDYVTEIVINDIQSGRIDFNFDLIPVDKAGYKKGMKEYRASSKRTRKRVRQYKRDVRKRQKQK